MLMIFVIGYIILKVHTKDDDSIENSNLLSEIPELSQIRKSIAFDSKLH